MGPIGLQGFQGTQGPQGPIGPAGPAGPQGNPGPIGPGGPQGPVGPAGPSGTGGGTGATGATGVIVTNTGYAMVSNTASFGTAGSSGPFPVIFNGSSNFSGPDWSIGANTLTCNADGTYEIKYTAIFKTFTDGNGGFIAVYLNGVAIPVSWSQTRSNTTGFVNANIMSKTFMIHLTAGQILTVQYYVIGTNGSSDGVINGAFEGSNDAPTPPDYSNNAFTMTVTRQA
jgi:hypothetical protein